jgi:hypothetical protein
VLGRAGQLDTKRKDYASIRVDADTKAEFDRQAKERDLLDGQFLRHLLTQNAQLSVSSVRGEEGEILVTYRAIVHTPVLVQGTVSRWAVPEPPKEEESPEPTNNT